jgi:hypothetical protein
VTVLIHGLELPVFRFENAVLRLDAEDIVLPISAPMILVEVRIAITTLSS